MPAPTLHRFQHGGHNYAIDPESCFCFECDAISWDVLEHYPHQPMSAILHTLAERYPRREIEEVIGELEWLRTSKSILKRLGNEELKKLYAAPTGLREVVAVWSGAANASAILTAAGHLLLARAEQPPRLLVRVPAAKAADPALHAALAELRRAAQLAAKPLTIGLETEALQPARADAALAPHAYHVRLDFAPEYPLDAAGLLARLVGDSLGGWVKRLDAAGSDARAVLVVRPGRAEFAAVLPVLDTAGFRNIRFDVAPLYVRDSEVSPEAVFASLVATAEHYAKALLRGQYTRVDPFASQFWRIFQGKGEARQDPVGVHQLAVDAEGRIYPSAAWLDDACYALGSVVDGTLDEAARKRYEDLGALTTPACMRCWARNLCGGGEAAIHAVRSGDFRTPEPQWCELQRGYLEAAIGAFNVLSAAGVNFSRVYQALGRVEKPSLFQLARAAFRTHLGVRPIEEADAALLTRWENWSSAAYFALHEASMFMATTYDREMDALYPREYEHELMLVRRDGRPLGLLRVRPDRQPGLARAWIFFPRAADYADSGIRRGFREILREAASQRALETVLVPAGPFDTGLAEFLGAAGFVPAGTEREALFLHGTYHDVQLFALRLA